MLALMGGIVFYASLDNPSLEQAEIELYDVEIIEINSVDDIVKLQISFLIKNPSERTFTVPIITFELFSNGEHIGTGQYSTADIAMPGRVVFFPSAEIPLKTFLSISRSDINPEIYQAIIDGEKVDFTAKGMLTVETAWSLIEKEF